MTMHGGDFVCLSDDDGLTHIGNLLKFKHTTKDNRTLRFGDLDVKSILLLNPSINQDTMRIPTK